MSKIAINEEMNLHQEWFEQAKKQTLETLPKFVDHVMNDYVHDYGTVCHAIAACAIAAGWAANESEGAQGGITGFQAGFVMWDFIRQWEYTHNKAGLRIIDYDNMLYPQYEEDFQKTISASTWEALKSEAKKELERAEHYAHQDVVKHWHNIVNGKVPFGYMVKKG